MEGAAEAKRSGQSQWEPALLNSEYCPGDMVRVLRESRAALVLSNETVLRLDQNTTVTLTGAEQEGTPFLELITGVAHFISRVPHRLKIITPFMNAAIEGTEFVVAVKEGRAVVTVFEGRVLASNNAGSLTLAAGQAAAAAEGQPPAMMVPVHPRDAVKWALYYPPVFGYAEGLEKKEEEVRTRALKAASLLSRGRVDEAGREIEQALAMAPDNSETLALQSVIAVAQNEKEKALELALKAVNADIRSVPARIALSYAQQANLDLKGAQESLKEAVRIEPGNSLAWARLAEIQLSQGELDEALKAAQEAVALNPGLSRTQSVLGFAYLTQIRTGQAIEAFEKAIEQDQADPLARLGLGLAEIRQGHLADGRREIEIAAALDPGQSLVRSYLGKAYFEEKR
ncbi:MAG: tetratricopeptide repeat protein, partial [bacterium]